ncbi:MAG TPA: hypothetical protein VFN23_18395 [Ktedonobacteraceae bacterium]|nr:hypothetical protein [Ktedonobacteraceae bacterium]
MPLIWSEAFLVTLVSHRPMLIREQQEQLLPALMIPSVANNHPNESVIHRLRALFEEKVDISRTIVHSTSWRYEPQNDWLLLTYIVVLPQGPWLDQWIASKRIVLEPIEGATLQGNQLFPPAQIGWSAALAHALDHLAALNTYDTAIQAVLEPAWHNILRQRTQKPAGCLQRDMAALVPNC